jgi:hypothetical protein
MPLVRTAIVLLLVTGLLPIGSRPADAQTTLTITGTPASMVVSTAVAGSQPTPITVGGTTIRIVAKCGGQCFNHVTAQLNTPMPASTTLSVALGAPPFPETTAGPVILSTTPQSVINNLKQENGVTVGITYVFTATVAAGVVPSQTRTVTFTLVSGP